MLNASWLASAATDKVFNLKVEDGNYTRRDRYCTCVCFAMIFVIGNKNANFNFSVATYIYVYIPDLSVLSGELALLFVFMCA